MHMQNRLQYKGDISKRLRKHPIRSGLLSLLTRKVILYELWSSQYCCEMIELADSRVWSANRVLSCAESVREVHSVLPFNFPVKSGSLIYFINVGIHLLMCSGKLYCVRDLGDFCSWNRSFWVGMYGPVSIVLFSVKHFSTLLLTCKDILPTLVNLSLLCSVTR